MKNILLASIIGFLSIVPAVNALQVTVTPNTAIQPASSCTVVHNQVIYGNTQYQLKDALNTDGVYFVSNLSTVNINVLGGKASIDPNFSQPSNYTPGPGSYTVAWQNGKTFLNLTSLVPADRDTTIAQVNYKIRRVPLGAGVTPDLDLVSVPDYGPTSFP